MWSETEIEKLLKSRLNELDSSVLNHEKFYQQYEQVRKYMIEYIYPNIASQEPNLTDHGETHIQNVLINAYKLIEHSLNEKNKYSPLDLYVLCSAILIHDIGNIHGREGHEQKLKKIYNSKNVFSCIDSSEKRIIANIAKSHGGQENTILKLPSSDHISGEEIQSRCIAGLLRFADELAEGPQRTSQYMLDNKMFSNKSEPYHQYATISEVPAIKQDTIILKYNIVVSNFLECELEILLLLTYYRIYKLNRERINCGIYSRHIQRIKKISITIKFYKKEEDIDVISYVDNNLMVFELNNLDCNKIKECKVKEKYTNKLMKEIKQFCKTGESNV